MILTRFMLHWHVMIKYIVPGIPTQVQSLNLFVLLSGNPKKNTSAFGGNGKPGWNEHKQCMLRLGKALAIAHPRKWTPI